MKPCVEAKGWRNSKGYVSVWFQGKTNRAHRVAFFKAHGWWPDEVGHLCNNPPCAEPSHLYATTTLGNNQYKTSLGRHAHHETHGMAKLTADQVQKIRDRYQAGEQQRPLAKEFGISQAQVHNIVSHKQWT